MMIRLPWRSLLAQDGSRKCITSSSAILLRKTFKTSYDSTSRRPALFSTQATDPGLSKVVGSAEEALKDLSLENATIAVGGFGLGGIPETLITAVSHHATASNLTIVSLTAGTDTEGTGKILASGKVRRLIAAYVGENKFLEQEYFGGNLQVALTPMGTIAERLRAGGQGTSNAPKRGYGIFGETLVCLMELHSCFCFSCRYSGILYTHWGWDDIRTGRDSPPIQNRRQSRSRNSQRRTRN